MVAGGVFAVRGGRRRVFSGEDHQSVLFLDPSPASHIRKAAKLPTAIGILLSCAKKSGVEKEPAGRFLPEEKSGRPLVPSQQASVFMAGSRGGCMSSLDCRWGCILPAVNAPGQRAFSCCAAKILRRRSNCQLEEYTQEENIYCNCGLSQKSCKYKQKIRTADAIDRTDILPRMEKKYTFGPGYGAGPEQRSADLTKLKKHHSDRLAGLLTPFRLRINSHALSFYFVGFILSQRNPERNCFFIFFGRRLSRPRAGFSAPGFQDRADTAGVTDRRSACFPARA